MNSGASDLNKVWEIRALKRKPNSEEARKTLQRIASQVQPIMRKHNWRVKLLSEMCPSNGRLLGLNVGAGVHVKLRLRRANRDDEFIPFHEVLDTMLHELCHNAHGPHNASFYKLWDDLRKECDELISKGISGSGKGFDLPGRRLGGFSHQPPLSSLRQTTLTAAEKRVRLGSLLPSGPKRLGGDSDLMAALSPVQAAAMAAERRLRDNIWCASEFYDLTEDEEKENSDYTSVNLRGLTDDQSRPSEFLSLKRKCAPNDTDTFLPQKGNQDSKFMRLERDTSSSQSIGHHDVVSNGRDYRGNNLSPPFIDLSTDDSATASTSVGDHNHMTSSEEESALWACRMCTFLNSVSVQ
ncbi:OLC1v1022522C2 [Oldenlandia corymbosa var. corymbosa]|uniref:OLC1v1022522C2 n=1 Tax=Oldenlandia corymbosa var. corymbosa TaxID=529605 RepID=A0AAV1C0U9_OLDCO|nr:OLC1v1022522C2 [Oldenlandia corymbosa var. corymbosa]